MCRVVAWRHCDAWASERAAAAGVQLCVCIPNFRILEYQPGDVPWRDELVDPPLVLGDGHLVVLTDPGLGMRLTHAAAKEYGAGGGRLPPQVGRQC